MDYVTLFDVFECELDAIYNVFFIFFCSIIITTVEIKVADFSASA